MDGLKKYSNSGMKKKTFWFVEEKGLKRYGPYRITADY